MHSLTLSSRHRAERLEDDVADALARLDVAAADGSRVGRGEDALRGDQNLNRTKMLENSEPREQPTWTGMRQPSFSGMSRPTRQRRQ